MHKSCTESLFINPAGQRQGRPYMLTDQAARAGRVGERADAVDGCGGVFDWTELKETRSPSVANDVRWFGRDPSVSRSFSFSRLKPNTTT